MNNRKINYACILEIMKQVFRYHGLRGIALVLLLMISLPKTVTGQVISNEGANFYTSNQFSSGNSVIESDKAAGKSDIQNRNDQIGSKNIYRDPSERLQQAIRLLESGLHQSAADELESLRAEYPNHPAPYINLAATYALLGRLDDARQMLMKADSLDSGRYQTHLSLSSVYLGLALASARKASEISPDLALQKRAREIELLIQNSPNVVTLVNKSRLDTRRSKPDTAIAPDVKHNDAGTVISKSVPQKGDRLSLSSSDLTYGGIEKETSTQDKFYSASRPLTSSDVIEVISFLDDWRNAWMSRDLPEYLSYYSNRFKGPNGSSITVWSRSKHDVFSRTEFIRVEIKVLRANVINGSVSVIVNQRYHSNLLTENIKKELVVVPENGSWRIISEKPV